MQRRSWLEQLPEHLLDRIIRVTLADNETSRLVFLSSLGSRIHASTVRALFSSLNVEDCEERFPKSSVYPVITSPTRYGHNVKSLTVTNPTFGDDIEGIPALKPISADGLSRLLQSCSNLESFCWESSLPPPDGVCEQLSSFNTRLAFFNYNPNHPKSDSGCTSVKWSAPSLPLLKNLPLVALSLKYLSQAGARALARLLSIMKEDGALVLEDLDLDLLWLDERLCQAIAEAGFRIRRLRLRTNGTKLNDKGLTSIIEKCDNLEELIFDRVQGRISRSFWTKPVTFSSALRCLRISISGSGHSWARDHLDSLASFPLEQLTELYISSESDSLPSTLPSTLSERFRDCKSLTQFHCDHWAIPSTELKTLLESCNRLENLKFCLDAAFSKLLGLTSTFASLSNLHTLSVFVHPEHAPGVPPVALLPGAPAPLTSTCTSDMPALKEKPIDDPSLPLLRDVKRFVRKCPKLELLEWYGKCARGSWIVKRPLVSSKINVTVEHHPPRLAFETWKEMLREDQIQSFFKRGRSWLEETRSGQQWTGLQAEILASDAVDQAKEIETEKNPRQPESKKPRVLSFSTSSSSISDLNLPLTPTRASMSPVDVHSPSASPIDPISMSRYLDFSSNSAFTSAQVRDHRRSPSEPAISPNTTGNSRNGSSGSIGTRDLARTRPTPTARGRGKGFRKASVDEGGHVRREITGSKEKSKARAGGGGFSVGHARA